MAVPRELARRCTPRHGGRLAVQQGMWIGLTAAAVVLAWFVPVTIMATFPYFLLYHTPAAFLVLTTALVAIVVRRSRAARPAARSPRPAEHEYRAGYEL